MERKYTLEMNWDLKLALVKKFGSQIKAARKLGIRESRLSYIVRGHVKPSKSEHRSLAKALGWEFVNQVFQVTGPHAENLNGGE
jgi:ribosome-binding protein aMBF1 (putative translation factor)